MIPLLEDLPRPLIELIQKPFGAPQRRGLEPFPEPAVNGGENSAGIGAPVLPVPQAREARGRVQLPQLRVLAARDGEALLEALSCTRFPWTPICPTGAGYGEVQHERDRSQRCG